MPSSGPSVHHWQHQRQQLRSNQAAGDGGRMSLVLSVQTEMNEHPSNDKMLANI